MGQPIKTILVAGARPNFMKIAPLLEALRQREGRFDPRLVHTGQHYDEALSKVFFEELGIPRPDRNLEVGSASHARQTAEVMLRFEPVLLEERPDIVVVVGDVNSTVACSLVAAKLEIPVVHVEAGLRSFDRSMPEEINRVVTDSISTLLLASESSGVTNLRAEGVPEERVHFVGNVMIDTLLRHRAAAERSEVLETLGLASGEYAVLTLHRPSNVDDPETFSGILLALESISAVIPIVFPVHPRTVDRARSLGFGPRLDAMKRLVRVAPLGYLDFLRLQASARLVLTDSGGIQEETTILGVPCLTLRENTERPVTIECGTNRLVGTDPERIQEDARRAIRGEIPIPEAPPPLWDGQAGRRIADVLERAFGG